MSKLWHNFALFVNIMRICYYDSKYPILSLHILWKLLVHWHERDDLKYKISRQAADNNNEIFLIQTVKCFTHIWFCVWSYRAMTEICNSCLIKYLTLFVSNHMIVKILIFFLFLLFWDLIILDSLLRNSDF